MIQIENLEKNYDNFKLNLSLSLEPGRVSGLIGRNGAGKSTTLKSILGLVKPDSGSVITLGTDALKLTSTDKNRLGVAFSDSGFSSYLSIQDIISVLKRMYTDFDEPAFRSLCQKHNLPLKKRTKEFSTGMVAKLKVLIALSHNASLLILDEPTAGLDVIARNEVLDMLRNYLAQDDSRSILISSHISSDLEGLCDDIYMLHDGKLIFHEETDVLLSEYGILKVNDQVYESLDKQHLLKVKKEAFGYSCLTNQRQYYIDNYKDIVIENGNIDDLIVMMEGGN